MAKGNLRGTVNVAFVAGATLSAQQQRTGRRIHADSIHAHVRGWATSTIEGHAVEREFVGALAAVRPLTPNRYANVVVLRRVSEWSSWLHPDWQPKLYESVA